MGHMIRRRLATLLPAWRRAVPVTASLGGLGCFSAAGFTVSDTIGLIVTGASLLVAAWLSDTPAPVGDR